MQAITLFYNDAWIMKEIQHILSYSAFRKVDVKLLSFWLNISFKVNCNL